jgi:hypothetical protein
MSDAVRYFCALVLWVSAILAIIQMIYSYFGGSVDDMDAIIAICLVILATVNDIKWGRE